jgi:hypothetical protein
MPQHHRRSTTTRRDFLRAGACGSLGLTLPGLLHAATARPSGQVSASPISACIVIFYYGGPSHLDTWDMKPDAPSGIRGEFKPIATNVPGRFVSEHLPHSARVVDKLAVIRGFHHPMRNHNAAAVEALAGRTPLKGDLELLAEDANDFPCYGAALSHLLPKDGAVPSFVALPHVMRNVVKLPGQNAGFLGSANEPLQVIRDPNAPDFRVDELTLPDGMTGERLESRRSLLDRVDDHPASSHLDIFRERAHGLLRSESVHRAFDIHREDPRLRDRYGRNLHGQSVLLARRLVEAGVRVVCVYDKDVNGLDNWDTHVDNFGRLKNALLPPSDRAFGTLVEDLHERGMLDSTLVVALGEFGRTPKIGGGGRDHWPDCYCVVVAGGGVKGGTVYGSSDKIGAFPDADPVTPGDLAATIYWRFGLDPKAEVHDLTGRPYTIAAGQPVRALFG